MATNERLPSTEVMAAGRQPVALAPEIIDAELGDPPRRHLRDHLRVLHKYRWLAGTCFGLTVGLTTVVTLIVPRLYTASTRLQVARQSPIQLRLDENVLRVDDSDRNVNGASSFLATQVATLQSRDLAVRTIRKHRLAENDAFLRPGSGRQGLVWIGGRLLNLLRPRGWESPPGPAAEVEAARSTQIDPVLLDRYMRYLAVRDVRGTDLVEVRFTTPSPTLSAFLAAAHTQAYLEANDEARLATNVTAKDFLGRQLRASREQVGRAEEALGRFATEHPSVAVNQEQKIAGQRVADLSGLLTKAEATRLTLQSRYEFLTAPESETLGYFLDRPGIQKLHLALLDLRAQRAAFGNRLGPNHVQMVELRKQEAEVEQQLQAETAEEVAAVRARHDASRLREDGLRHKLAQQEEAAIELWQLGARYELLEGDVASARTLYGSLLKQQMETAVNSALAAANVRVVERAEVPQRPSKPNVPLNLTLGVLAGLVLGVGVAFVCESFDSSVKSRDEVQGLLQLPTLATIPNFALAARTLPGRRHAPASDGNGNGGPPAAHNGYGRELVLLHEPRSAAAEAFRSMRTAVLFSTPGAPPRVILVTSAGAGEGKTVNSVNLATSLADAGSRVLLIDADLRRPGCHRALGVENARGLSSYLTGQTELEGVIHALEIPRLFFIPAGPSAPNPAELVGSARMCSALEQLQETHDFVILDSPPVLPVTDAVVLAREADGVVLVVKGHDTPRELVRQARDQLLQAGAHLLGAVVNNVDPGWGNLYFYQRYYGPYYGPPAELEERA